jgi:guanylate kinase
VAEGKNPPGKRAGIVFVLSGPAGSGKTALVAGLRQLEPDLYFCVTATTRPPRPGERDGIDYFFLSRDEFLERAEHGDLLEYAQVPPGVGHLYGSPRQQVLDAIAAGRDVFLQVDVQGARSVRSQLAQARTIFLKPPDMETLRARLIKRGTEPTPEMKRRLANAEVEIGVEPEFQYSVVNADEQLDQAIASVREIIRIEREAANRRDTGTDGLG